MADRTPIHPSRMRHRRTLVAVHRLVAALLLLACAKRQTPSAGAALPSTALADHLWLVRAPQGNVVVLTGSDGALVAGTQAAAATPALRASIRALGDSTVRWVLFEPGDAREQGDAGWSGTGATIVAHENLRRTVGRVAPALGFSEVVQFYLDGESAHAIHMPPGHSDADFIVHFENAGVLYLGNSFVSDGYPTLDLDHGARIDSLIATVAKFTDFGSARIVPGRGPVATSVQVADYRDMLTAVRDRVRALVAQGKSEQDVIAAKPTASFDTTYGRGGAPPDEFVRMVYRSVTSRR